MKSIEAYKEKSFVVSYEKCEDRTIGHTWVLAGEVIQK